MGLRGDSAGVDHVAFENPNGQKILVLTNSRRRENRNLKQSNKTAELTLPAESITTLIWK